MKPCRLLFIGLLLLLSAFAGRAAAQDPDRFSLNVGNRWVYDYRVGATDIFYEEQQDYFAHERKRNTCVLEIVGDTTIEGEQAAIVALIDVPRQGDMPFMGDRIYWVQRDSAFLQYGTYECFEPETSAKWLWYDKLESDPDIVNSADITYCDPDLRIIDAQSDERIVLGDPKPAQSWSHWLLRPDGGTTDNFVFSPEYGILEFAAVYRWRNSTPDGFLATLRGTVIDGVVLGDTSVAIDTIFAPQVDSADLACLLRVGNRWVYTFEQGSIENYHRPRHSKIANAQTSGMMTLEIIGDTVFSQFDQGEFVKFIDAVVVEARNLPASDGKSITNKSLYWSIIGDRVAELVDNAASSGSPEIELLWSAPRAGGRLEPFDVFGEIRTGQVWSHLRRLNSDFRSETETWVFSPELGPLMHLVSTTVPIESGVTAHLGSYAELRGAVICDRVYGDTTVTGVHDNPTDRGAGFQVFPALVQDDVHLRIPHGNAREYSILVHDLQGRLLHSELRSPLNPEVDEFIWPLQSLAGGTFIVTVVANGQILGRSAILKSP